MFFVRMKRQLCRSIGKFYLMVVFDTLFSGLFGFYGGLHQAAPSCKIGRMAVHRSASAAPATARAKE